MLTSTSPQTLRLHSELPITQSRGHFSNLNDFDSLNRAFQLATGWTLGFKTEPARSTGIAVLQIIDLAATANGRAVVGRRYADNLVSSFNRYLKCNTKNVVECSNEGKRSINDILLSNFEIGSAERKQQVQYLHHCATGRHLTDSHAKRNGDVVLLLARVRSRNPRNSGVTSLDAHLRIRLETAFACLAERIDKASDLLASLHEMLHKFSNDDFDIAIDPVEMDIVIVRDRLFECEVASFDSRLKKPAQNPYLFDFNLGTIKQLDLRPDNALRLSIPIEQKWIGHGQALVIAPTSSQNLQWHQFFGPATLFETSRLRAAQVSRQISNALGEPEPLPFCPIVIRRK